MSDDDHDQAVNFVACTMLDALRMCDPEHQAVGALCDKLADATRGQHTVVAVVALMARLSGVLSQMSEPIRELAIMALPELVGAASENIEGMRGGGNA